MQCCRVEKRIQDLLDDQLDPSFDSELIQHAATCAACHDVLEVQGKLFDGLQVLTVPSLSDDFSQRVVDMVVIQRRRPLQRDSLAAAFLAITAALLVFLALGPWNRKQDNLPKIASATVEQLVPVGPTRLSASGLDSDEVRLAFEQLVAQLTSGSGSGFYQVEQLTGTIRPLASTLNVAIDAIRRSLPRRPDRPHS
jgi:hypothetical protein